MAMTDPIADMLTRIRNGLTAKLESVIVPASNMKKAIAQILVEEGYVKSASIVKDEKGIQDNIVIELKYGPNNTKVISGLKRISKPGLRVYASRDELPKVLKGLGIAIISTSAGLMTQKECLQQGIGGEIVAYVW